MKKLLAVIALIVLVASWARGQDEEKPVPKAVNLARFKESKARKMWASKDGEFTVYSVPCIGSQCEIQEQGYGLKCGKENPTYYLMELDNSSRCEGWSNFEGIRRLRPGVYFTILSSNGCGEMSGISYNFPLYYFKETKELRILDSITTCWGHDGGSGEYGNINVKVEDLDRDGALEVVVHRSLAYLNPDGCIIEKEVDGRVEKEYVYAPCPPPKKDWTRLEKVLDSNGKDVTRWLGQAPCWGEQWPDEFMVTSGDSVSGKTTRPDWKNPKAWEGLESNRFALTDFITTKRKERWKGPADLSFEVKLGYTDQYLLRVLVHDDAVVFDPALRPIYRDHVELWIKSREQEGDALGIYQLGLLPPKPGGDRGEVEVWKSCREKCSSTTQADRPYPVGRVETKWNRTDDGYEVLVALPRAGAFASQLAVCVSDNDSALVPGQKVMMCDRPPSGDYRGIGSCNEDGCY